MISSLSTPSANFLAYNAQQSKQLNVVVDIDGLPLLSTMQIGRNIIYGDPITYGETNLIYGGLVPVGLKASERQQQNLLMTDGGSLTISQRLEPEQGRGSISTLNLNFVDKNGLMTQYVSPGITVPEILSQQVKIWIGYGPTSFPQDYFVVWRGRVGQVTAHSGQVSMQFVDPNVIRRQQVLYGGQSQLLGNIPASSTSKVATYDSPSEDWTCAAHGFNNGDVITITSTGSIPTGYTLNTAYFIITATVNTFQLSTDPSGDPVPTTDDGSGTITVTNDASVVPILLSDSFFSKIQGPSGGYDTSLRLFLLIESEWIEYQVAGTEATSMSGSTFLHVNRGDAVGAVVPNMSTPNASAAHTAGTQVDNYMMFSGHAMDIALKLMLSGWGGPYNLDNDGNGSPIYGLVTTNDSTLPTVSNGIILPINVDAIRDLGITVGDYITISGDPLPGNNVTCVVTGFDDLSNGNTNRVITTNGTFTASEPSVATIAIRSQYDVYPTMAGCALPGWEVDVGTFQYYKNTYLVDSSNQYLFLINGPETGKTFIESEILLPLGAYSLTRQGKISMGITKPPLADQRTLTLSIANVLDPQNIQISRGINNRKYFNEIDWSYDCDETNTPTNQRNTINFQSLATFGLSSVLPITSRGARTGGGFLTVVANRETAIFNRYKNAAVLLNLKTTLAVGNQIEAGDILIVQDNGQLQIPNFATGVRNLGVQYMEVINRDLDLKAGNCSLQLEGNTGAFVTDRYGTIAPSSLLTDSSTASRIVITESFGAVFPNNEQKKWIPYVGLKVWVHSPDFLNSGVTTFTGLDPNNNHALLLSPALSFTPKANYVLDLAPYPTDTNSSDQALAKLIHGFSDLSVQVASGISQTEFSVSSGNIGNFAEGQYVWLHDVAYATTSPNEPYVQIAGISGNNITVNAPLGFIPDARITIELIGFADGGQPYLLI